MALPVINDSLSCAPEASLLQLESPKIILQVFASSYPTDIPNMMSTFWMPMNSCSSTSRSSFMTTSCTPLLWPISHMIPPVFQHPSQQHFHNRGIPWLKIIATGNLQVNCPQPCHLRFHQITHMRGIPHIHPLLPVNIKVLRPPELHHQICLIYFKPLLLDYSEAHPLHALHAQGYQPKEPQLIHLIKPILIVGV